MMWDSRMLFVWHWALVAAGIAIMFLVIAFGAWFAVVGLIRLELGG
jgi:hypothetical protein